MMAKQTWTHFVWMVCCFVIGYSGGSDAYKRVCYFTNWARYRTGPARYDVANVDPFLCTHLIYAFADFDGQGNITPEMGDSELATYAQFNALKQRNPHLKTMIAVGGWRFGSRKFSEMAGNSISRRRFVSHTVSFLHQHGFDGLDIDWEYPGLRGGSAKDRDNLVLLCKELKQAFSFGTYGNKQLILSAAVPAARSKIDVGYNVQQLNRYLDLWNIMTYDYHGGWEAKTGHNSPLYVGSRDVWDQRTMNMEWTVEEYVRRGASKDKVMVGLPTYGHSYRLSSFSQSQPGAPASIGIAGPYTGERGFWAYYEVCQKIAEGSGVVKRDAEQRVPYYVKDDLWISFDDVESIKEKTRWLKKNGYGGYMTWAIDMDVFDTSLCPSASSPYPLLSAANSILQESSGSRTRVKSTTARPRVPRTTTTSAPGRGAGSKAGSGSSSGSGSKTGSGSQTGTDSTEFSCAGRPFKGYKDPSNPCRFIVCWAGNPFPKPCPTGLVFDERLGVCDRPRGTVTC